MTDEQNEATKGSESDTNALLSVALRALCLTRDYVGEKTLPAIDGWEWYEAGKAIAEKIPDDEWAIQFYLRVAKTKEHNTDGGDCFCNPDVIHTNGTDVIVHKYD